MAKRRSGRTTSTVIPAPGDRPEIEVRASTARVKSATARFEGNRFVVLVPAHLSVSEREEMVTALLRRATKRRATLHTSDAELFERALALAPAYVGTARPQSVRFVANQRTRWASCSAGSGEIRISDRLRGAPQWVLDVVVIHELCHLVHLDHSPAFHSLADRAPRKRDAEMFLLGLAFADRADSMDY